MSLGLGVVESDQSQKSTICDMNKKYEYERGQVRVFDVCFFCLNEVNNLLFTKNTEHYILTRSLSSMTNIFSRHFIHIIIGESTLFLSNSNV